jgi:small-conductance mechanosensitive channel
VSWDASWLDHRAARAGVTVLITAVAAALLCAILVGVATAALNFPETRLAASAALSSAAVLAVISGLAAQSTLSNLVAGPVLALSHPIRLGERARVDDGRRIVYPNSLPAASALSEPGRMRASAMSAEILGATVAEAPA